MRGLAPLDCWLGPYGKGSNFEPFSFNKTALFYWRKRARIWDPSHMGRVNNRGGLEWAYNSSSFPSIKQHVPSCIICVPMEGVGGRWSYGKGQKSRRSRMVLQFKLFSLKKTACLTAFNSFFSLRKTIENLFRSVLGCMNESLNFENSAGYGVGSSTHWKCNTKQILLKNENFQRRRNVRRAQYTANLY